MRDQKCYLAFYLFIYNFYDCYVFAGGGSLLSRQEHDAIRAEVDAEFEAGERKTKKKNKNAKKTKKNYALEDDMGLLFGDGITGKLPRFANKITLKVCALLLFKLRLCWVK